MEVNREGLEYRAGWVEALQNFAQRLQLQGMRASKKEIPGLEAASKIAAEMHAAMLKKMKGE